MDNLEIFMIGCPHLSNRLDFQKKQFSDLDLEFKLINCVKINKVGNFINKPTKSLFLSHFKCIKRALKSNKYVLILEDDAKITDKKLLFESINSAIEIEHEWDMMYFYTNTDKKKIEEKNHYLNTIKFNGMTHAYIINPKKLKLFYDEMKEFYKKVEKGNVKLKVEECSTDRFFIKYIHPFIRIISTKKELIIQARNLFGSTLGWGWNNTGVIVDYDE